MVYLGGHLIAPDLIQHFDTIAARIIGDVLKSRGELRGSGLACLPLKAVSGFAAHRGPDLPKTVSSAEIQIMGLVGQGLTNRQIAGELKLSEGTIRNYVSTVLQKTGLHDRTQMAVFAIRNGL
jgi:DNA-binding NarL/FixJ family response regulator